MNTIPPNSYNRPVVLNRQATKKLDNTDNQAKKPVHRNRRTQAERRRNPLSYNNRIDMRQNGDRRKANRLLITT